MLGKGLFQGREGKAMGGRHYLVHFIRCVHHGSCVCDACTVDQHVHMSPHLLHGLMYLLADAGLGDVS